jgi:hypothetical protein
VQGVADNPAAADLLEGFHFGQDGNDTVHSIRCAFNLEKESRVNVSNLSVRPLAGSNPPPVCAINDNNAGVLIAAPPNSIVASYDMASPRYLGAMTVSSLPLASTNNAGAMFRVTDSTPIANEGQICSPGTPGNTATALAFSDGSHWKCF